MLAWLKAAASLNTQFVALAESDGARPLLANFIPRALLLTRARAAACAEELAKEALGGN